jgi:hypothetical protein
MHNSIAWHGAVVGGLQNAPREEETFDDIARLRKNLAHCCGRASTKLSDRASGRRFCLKGRNWPGCRISVEHAQECPASHTHCERGTLLVKAGENDGEPHRTYSNPQQSSDYCPTRSVTALRDS